MKDSLEKWRKQHKDNARALGDLEIGFDRADYLPILDFCKFKFLLHIPGVSGSGRFKRVMRACRCGCSPCGPGKRSPPLPPHPAV